uniref:Winged helix-turn-helix domain-containing protein n=1 Tax=mine drainage metagenome TaxID=410659 RepID=E6PQ93_9ZZZZ
MSPGKENAASLAGLRGASTQQNGQQRHPNTLNAQRQRVIERLRKGSADTITLRRDEDIMMPATRVHELRHQFGFDILSTRVKRETDIGRPHTVAMYTLLAEPKPGAQS